MRKSYINGYKEFKSRTKNYDEFYDNMTKFIQTLKEKNAITEDKIPEVEEWRQLSEMECQLEWLKNFKNQYLTK